MSSPSETKSGTANESAEPSVAAPTRGPAVLGAIAAVAALVATATVWVVVDERLRDLETLITTSQSTATSISEELTELQSKVASNETEISTIKLLRSTGQSKGFVDLAEPTIQDLEQSGFYVVKLAVEEHLTGVKVSGRMINTQSVDHTNITFELTVGGQSKQFTINRVSKGNSTAFSVYLPDVSKEEARYGWFAYLNSTLTYFIK